MRARAHARSATKGSGFIRTKKKRPSQRGALCKKPILIPRSGELLRRFYNALKLVVFGILVFTNIITPIGTKAQVCVFW